MDYLDQVRRGIDYIEANLLSDLQPVDIARQAGMSQWHFQRIFKSLTNETLKTYIRSRRFSQSLLRLALTKERVLDIALDSGFDSQSSFTRAFIKAFGFTPAYYRKHPTDLAFPRKLHLDAEYLNHLKDRVSLEPEFVEQPDMLLVGMRTAFFGVDSEKNNVAHQLPKLWAQFIPRIGEVPHRLATELKCGGYGVVRQTGMHTDKLEYWAALPVSQVRSLPPGLVSLRVPASRYARFVHHGYTSALDLTVSYIYSSWLLRSGMRHTHGCDLEYYGKGYSPDSDQSVLHYSIPVISA